MGFRLFGLRIKPAALWRRVGCSVVGKAKRGKAASEWIYLLALYLYRLASVLLGKYTHG